MRMGVAGGGLAPVGGVMSPTWVSYRGRGDVAGTVSTATTLAALSAATAAAARWAAVMGIGIRG